MYPSKERSSAHQQICNVIIMRFHHPDEALFISHKNKDICVQIVERICLNDPIKTPIQLLILKIGFEIKKSHVRYFMCNNRYQN